MRWPFDRGRVDELHPIVGATALGSSTPLFSKPASLRLYETRRYKGSDNVPLTYSPERRCA